LICVVVIALFAVVVVGYFALLKTGPTVQEVASNPAQWVDKNITITGTVGTDTATTATFQVLGASSIYDLHQASSDNMNTYALDFYMPALTSTALSYITAHYGATITVTGYLHYFTVVADVNATLWVNYGSAGIPANQTWSCYAFVVTGIS